MEVPRISDRRGEVGRLNHRPAAGDHVPLDMDREARTLDVVLEQQGLTHLHVIKRGKTLTIASGTKAQPCLEARLTHVHKAKWRLDLRHHTGRWDPTPFVGTMGELVDTAAGIGRLMDLDSTAPANRGDTSDPRH